MKRFAAGLILLVLLFYFATDEVRHPAGVTVPTEPFQRNLLNATAWQKDGFRIAPLADFDLRGRILGIERYWFDQGSRLSPVDLAVGWGPMSDSSVIDRLLITQAGRWFHWQPATANEFPLTPSQIARRSTNLHIIPASRAVANALSSLRRGHIVSLSGQLVAVEGEGGWKWRSSLARTDTGSGACELVWVNRLAIE